MDILFEWFWNGVIRVCTWIGMLIGMGIQRLYLGVFRASAYRTVKQTALQKSEADDTRRLAGCGEVVTGFATHFGYIARECISKAELEEKIHNGISPDELRDEI